MDSYTLFIGLTALCAILAVTLTAMAIPLARKTGRVRSRLNAIAGTSSRREGPDAPVSEANEATWLASLRPMLEPLMEHVPPSWRRNARLSLGKAGLLHVLTETEFLFLRAVAVLASIILAGLELLIIGRGNLLMGFASAGLTMMVGLLLPDYVIQRRVNQRQAQIRRTLPDALDLLVVSIEAGTGFDAAMARVGDKFPGAIADEFNRVLHEMRLGRTRGDALRDMGERVALKEVSAFVAAVRQADQLGVSLSRVVKIQSETLRVNRVHHIRELAQKLPVKMLFPLVFFIFPSIFVAILGPGLIRIVESLSQ